MRTRISLLLILGFQLGANAQSISPQVIGSAGEYSSGTNADLQWTVGEIMIETFSNNYIITQGFHQVDDKVLNTKDVELIQMSVYPNPTHDLLTLSFGNNPSGFTYSIYAYDGRLISTEHVTSGVSSAELDISNYAAGQYFLKIKEHHGSRENQFQIQKLK